MQPSPSLPPTATQDGLIVPGTWAGSNTVADAEMMSCPSAATTATLADAATQTVALAGLQSALNVAVYNKTGASTVATISAVAAAGLLTVVDSSFGGSTLTYRVQEVAASRVPLAPEIADSSAFQSVCHAINCLITNIFCCLPWGAGLRLPARGHRRCLH